MTKESRHRCFPVNIAKFLLLPILKNICKWLLFNLFNGSLLHDFRVPFLVSCCQFIKTITLKSFNEIVLPLSVESKTIILYVNINFTGNLFFGSGRYCPKVVPETGDSHPFCASVLTDNVLSIFFFTLALSN